MNSDGGDQSQDDDFNCVRNHPTPRHSEQESQRVAENLKTSVKCVVDWIRIPISIVQFNTGRILRKERGILALATASKKQTKSNNHTSAEEKVDPALMHSSFESFSGNHLKSLQWMNQSFLFYSPLTGT